MSGWVCADERFSGGFALITLSPFSPQPIQLTQRIGCNGKLLALTA